MGGLKPLPFTTNAPFNLHDRDYDHEYEPAYVPGIHMPKKRKSLVSDCNPKQDAASLI